MGDIIAKFEDEVYFMKTGENNSNTIVQSVPVREMTYGFNPKEAHKKILCYQYDLEKDSGFVIINRGSHPCVYVTSPEIRDLNCDLAPIDDIFELKDSYRVPHGGFTFYGKLWDTYEMKSFFPDVNWLGWDYAHSGDYLSLDTEDGYDIPGKKWQTRELIKEAKTVLQEIHNGNYIVHNKGGN